MLKKTIPNQVFLYYYQCRESEKMKKRERGEGVEIEKGGCRQRGEWKGESKRWVKNASMSGVLGSFCAHDSD